MTILTDQMSEHEVVGLDLGESLTKTQAEENGTIANAPPEIKFIKKTWRHRLQELNLRKNIVSLMSRSGRSIFKLVPLEEAEKTYEVPRHDPLIGKVRWFTFPRRCTVCLDPAIHKVLMATDASFTSYRCDNDRCKKR